MNGSDRQHGLYGSDRPPDQDVFRITFDAASREALARIVREHPLELGPGIECRADGSVAVVAFADERQIEALRASGLKVEVGENLSALGRARQIEVGRGDRFEGGRVPPRGLGAKTPKGG